MPSLIRRIKLNPRRAWGLLAMFCAVVAAAVLAWHLVGEKSHDVETKGSTVTHLNTGYVDAQACATCHGTIAKTFKKTGMGRSFYRPTTENVIEDYKKANTFVHKASGLRYRMIERDGRFYERRFTLGKDGKEENVLEERIDYVMGSGNQARTYMHRTSQGKLVELPVSWYTERSGYWNMSPGFDRADHPDMHGAIGPECMFCHNGYPQLTDSSQAALEESIFPEKLPEGIDCQRCHGPGAAHVAAASGGKATLPEIRSKIVNPAKLPRDRQMEVCMECHMETSARHVPSAIRAYGRELYSFRPGEPLGDYKTYFERPKDPKSDDYEVAHAGYQLLRSACFRNTQMTCLTCHNPHDIPRGEAAKKQYIAVCETCHKQVPHKGVAMTAGNDCLSCHMPKRRTEGSVHIVLTDHYIQRVRPARDLTAPFPESLLPEDLTPVQIYYPKSTQPTAMEQLLLAVARVNDAGIDGVGELRAQLDSQHPQLPEPYVALGKGYARVGKTEDAVRNFNQALTLRPDDRAALRELSAALLSGGQVERAVETLQRATGIYPEDDGLLANLANAYLRAGKLAEAQEAISRTLAINPDRAEVHDLAGLVAIKKQDRAAAEQSFREAIRLKPNLAAPQNNLANLLVGERRYPEAEAYFRRALELKPDYGDAHHGLGLLMILERNNAEAAHELQEAARTAPTDPEVHTDLADLLSAQGRFADAAAEYRRALALQSGRPDANLGLGLVLLQQGQREEAFRYIQIAAHSSDAEVSQHAQGILGQILR